MVTSMVILYARRWRHGALRRQVRDVPGDQVDRLLVFAVVMMDLSEERRRENAEVQGANSGRARLGELSEPQVHVRHVRGDPPAPAIVLQLAGERLRLAQVLHPAAIVNEL